MPRKRRSITTSPEIIETIAERTKMTFQLQTMLIERLVKNEKLQFKFKNAVLIRLANIETKLTEIQGCQLAQIWSPQNRITDKQRDQYIRELEERMKVESERLGLKMVRYIYGDEPMLECAHDRRKKWHGWEI